VRRITLEGRTRQHQNLRVALVLQAVGLLGLIALAFPDWLDGYLHPHACTPDAWCLDFRGLAFDLLAIFLGPVIVVLLILARWWRGPRLWPLALVVLLDVAAIVLTVDSILNDLHSRTSSIPPVASAPPLLLLPALATLVLGINLVKPVPWKPLLAATAAGCIVMAAALWIRDVGSTTPL
jgi:hypothetical protein